MYNNFPLVELLRSHVPFEKIFLANDANAAAHGEALCGAAKGAKNAIMVTLGTGVGGGIVLDGKLYTGFNFAAGELGHMAIVYDGLPCTCGQKGCWEAYSSATALIKHTREVMQENPDSLMWKESATLDAVDGRTAFEASKKGDAAAQAVVDWYVGHLACGIINLLNIFQPDVLCIGGGICGQGDYLLRPLQALVEKNQFMTDVSLQSKLRIATLGNDADILGAALLGLQA
jgi:glucokinase